MSYKTAYKDIMREYETDRDIALTLQKKRRLEIYESLPRIKEIDAELAQIGISITRMAISSKGSLDNIQHQSKALREEKQQLYEKNGITEDYITNTYLCKKCQDSGFIQNERCTCLKQRLIEKYYDISNIRGQLAVENFDTFDIRYYSETINPKTGVSPQRAMQVTYQKALGFVKQFDESGKFHNLLFYGDTGLGKTFLCNCIAKDLLDSGRTVLYVTAPQIFKLIEDHRFNRNESELSDDAINSVTEVDLLILDDLGAEFSTMVTSAALFNIINQRILSKLPTVISTNLSPAELESNYSDRVVSRFWGYYQACKFYGEDIRHKKRIEGG